MPDLKNPIAADGKYKRRWHGGRGVWIASAPSWTAASVSAVWRPLALEEAVDEDTPLGTDNTGIVSNGGGQFTAPEGYIVFVVSGYAGESIRITWNEV